jgi:hypothetical protein
MTWIDYALYVLLYALSGAAFILSLWAFIENYKMGEKLKKDGEALKKLRDKYNEQI